MQGENQEGSRPEMSPEQQATHDEATKRDAGEISDEVKRQQEVLDFAQKQGLNVENVRKEMELVAEEEAYADYELDKVGKAAAESAIAAMMQARSEHLNVDIPIGYSYSGRLEEDSNQRLTNFLEAKLTDRIAANPPEGVDASKGDKVSKIMETPLGEFIYFRRSSGAAGDLKREYFVRAFNPK